MNDLLWQFYILQFWQYAIAASQVYLAQQFVSSADSALTASPTLEPLQMNQQCKVCGEPAAGFHFGAFTCEGCKSFFGRSYNNLSSISDCKNNGECIINKKNRTACKACRLRKCLLVGMSKSGSRYGRRSNWFKIHCLLQEQQQSGMPTFGGKSLTDPPITLTYPSAFLPPDVRSRISSPDSENSETAMSPYLPLGYPSSFLGTSPFLLHAPMFPFSSFPPAIKPEPSLTPVSDMDAMRKCSSSASPVSNNNNNEDSKNNNLLVANSKRFYLDAILGLQRDSPPPSSPTSTAQEEDGQETPIDLSLRSQPSSNEKCPEKINVKMSFALEEGKGLPLDLSV